MIYSLTTSAGSNPKTVNDEEVINGLYTKQEIRTKMKSDIEYLNAVDGSKYHNLVGIIY